MRKQHLLYLLLVLLLLLAACDRTDGEESGTPTPAATIALAASPTPTATSAPTVTATPPATPTPLRPMLTAQEQVVGETGEILVDSVTVPEPGWLVLYSDASGSPDEALDTVALDAGTTTDVILTVDPYQVTDVVHLQLWRDEGVPGEFEPNGPDEPWQTEGIPVTASISLQIDVAAPTIVVTDQEVTTEGKIVADAVVALTPGWLVLRADDDGEPGPVLGQSPVTPGETENVAVFFDWRRATRRLHAVLYEDQGEPGIFEPDGSDEPVVFRGMSIAAAFVVDLPPDVFVIDQPATTGEIIVDRAVINTRGWIAVYSDFNGFTDRLLGYAPLAAGVNEELAVPIEGTITSLLHIMLHEDTGVIGEFEYPSGDPPLRDDEGRAILFTFQTDGGNYIVTRNQPLAEDGSIEVPLVVTDLDAWVTVWTSAAGEPDTIIGRVLLPPGVHRNVRIEVDTAATTDQLFVVLHQDAGEAGQFEYPDGPDEILQHERNDIQAPFTLTAAP
jgi:hypothetical protein